MSRQPFLIYFNSSKDAFEILKKPIYTRIVPLRWGTSVEDVISIEEAIEMFGRGEFISLYIQDKDIAEAVKDSLDKLYLKKEWESEW